MARREPERVVRLRHFTLSNPPRQRWTDHLGYVLVWTALGTIVLTSIVILVT